MNAGLKVGVCTTSNEQTAKAITEDFLPDINLMWFWPAMS